MKIMVEDYSPQVNPTSVLAGSTKMMILQREVLTLLYVIGIVGCILAFLHLNKKRHGKNTKQIFMLKCLISFEGVGLVGMLSQLLVRIVLANNDFYRDHIQFICFVQIVWRFFGMSSGSVAFIMAIERYFALTKPFLYSKHFTNGLIKRLVFMMWMSCAFLTFAPIFGFGVFWNKRAETCERYRDAENPVDVAYAFLFFFVGTFLCLLMVYINFSVTRIVNRSYRSMQQLTLSCLESSQKPLKLNRPTISAVSSFASATSKSISMVTRDEVRFINMCNWLTASFVLCWGCQMITIPIAQFVENANDSKAIKIFYKIADFLLLIHFTMDPYIYVLLRTNYASETWLRFKNFIKQLLFKANDDFAVTEHDDHQSIFSHPQQ